MEVSKLDYKLKFLDFVSVYEINDGTFLYWQKAFKIMEGRVPQRLYVKWNGKEIDADLPDEKLKCYGAYDSAIYLCSKEKIFRVVFTPSDSFTVTFIRNVMKDERIEQNVCSISRDVKMLVYQICDNPETDGIFVDALEEELKGLKLKAVHRGKAIYFTEPTVKARYEYEPQADKLVPRPSVTKIGANVIVIGCKCKTILTRNFNRFVYFACWKMLYTLDTDTWQFLPPLQLCDNCSLMSINSVENGRVVADVYAVVDGAMGTAWLPTGYFEQKSPANERGSIKIQNWNDCDEPISSGSGTEFFSKFVNEYQINKILGAGGFGMVFEAIHRRTNCKYAIKRISVKSKDEQKAFQELRAMDRLDQGINHQGIMSYNEMWIERPPEEWQFMTDMEMLKNIGPSKTLYKPNKQFDSTFIYFQMPLCMNSLAGWLDDNRFPSTRYVPRMKSWFAQIVEAVAYIHKNNLIHRDLKPGNVLFFEENKLKVCDLGLATERRAGRGQDTAASRSRTGTQLYMSPEHTSSFDQYSSKTDVFALGLMLAELCVVMNSEARSEIFDNYRTGKQSDLIADYETNEFVRWLTQVDPKNRPTCQEMLDHSYLELA